MAHALDWIEEALAELERAGLRRTLQPLQSPPGAMIRIGEDSVVNFCSNDYLGLANDPAVKLAAQAAVDTDGAGSGAARLVTGDLPLHGVLERWLAHFKGTESALLFNSGYHANTGAIPALVGEGDAIFSDALNHASIVDGCRLARARTFVYPHKDVDALATQLHRSMARRKLIVTDSIFGMDGDAAPLADLIQVAAQHGAMLYVDEAHATGILGPYGAGLAEALGLGSKIDVQMGTLGKAIGSFGAFVAGRQSLIDWLANKARSFVFSTALPPSACGAALAGLDIVITRPDRRERLFALADRMRAGLVALGFPSGDGLVPIFPIIMGSEEVAVDASRRLRARGYYVRAIRPPTVPAGTSRLRISVMATHTEAQVDGFLAALAGVLAELRVVPKPSMDIGSPARAF